MKTYEIHARLPMTAAARNAGATGRKYWWALADTIKAQSARAACAAHRKTDFGSVNSAYKIKAVIQ